MQPYNPIVVIIVKKNHSFDNYFGSFLGVNGASLPPAQDPPAGDDPPHDHAAWLQRATAAVKLEGAVSFREVCEPSWKKVSEMKCAPGGVVYHFREAASAAV